MSSATFGNKLYLLLLHLCLLLDHHLPHQKYASVNSVSSGSLQICAHQSGSMSSLSKVCAQKTSDAVGCLQ